MSFSFKYRLEKFKDKDAYFPKVPVVLYNEGIKLDASG